MDLRLQFHPRKMNIHRVASGVHVLGYIVFPKYRLLRNDNGHRFQRKLVKYTKAYAHHRMNWPEINSRVQSWIGHAKQADTDGLRKQIFSNKVFIRE